MLSVARHASRLFRLFKSLRSRYGLDFDEVLAFFALGRLNFDTAGSTLAYVKPANILSLAEFLDVPRETLRRKLIRLEEKDLVQRTSYGYIVKDMATWRRLGEVFSQSADADA